MKKEYDFSKGERGKFFCPDTKLHVPVYLDSQVMQFVEQIADRKQTDPSSVVNRLLRSDMDLVETAR